MLNLIKKLFFKYTMDLNDILFGPERDRVTRASESTYDLTQLQQQGLQITVNTSSNKARWVGDTNNRIYPQIIVWRPDFPGSDTGRAVIVEAIETSGTLGVPHIERWRILSTIVGVHFNLIVPQGSSDRVRTLLRQNNIITGVNLQTYTYDSNTDRYNFIRTHI